MKLQETLTYLKCQLYQPFIKVIAICKLEVVAVLEHRKIALVKLHSINQKPKFNKIFENLLQN
jgi:hypothetical protein